MTVNQMSMQAWHALKAVELRHTKGRFPASRYAANNGVRSLYRLALQLSAVQ